MKSTMHHPTSLHRRLSYWKSNMKQDQIKNSTVVMLKIHRQPRRQNVWCAANASAVLSMQASFQRHMERVHGSDSDHGDQKQELTVDNGNEEGENQDNESQSPSGAASRLPLCVLIENHDTVECDMDGVTEAVEVTNSEADRSNSQRHCARFRA